MSHSSRDGGGFPATDLELRVWIELPLHRSAFPIRRKPSLALDLTSWKRQFTPLPRANATPERRPSLIVEAGMLCIVGAFLALVSIGLLGSALQTMLMWAL